MQEQNVPDSTQTNVSVQPRVARRKFLKGAAAGATGAAIAGFPMISVAQSPVVLKMQGAWGAKDIFNEMAEEYVKRVNEMSGGRLRIDYLVAGAVVKPFEVTDAVSKGVLDAGHSVPVYWYGKSKVASLFGSGPVTGCDAHQTLAWIYRGGGLALYNELLGKIGLDVVGFFAMPMPTQPLGWFKKPIKDASGLKGLKYRTVGLAADLMQEMGVKVTQLPGGEIVPAMERGVIDAFEYNNPTSDMRFGAQDVAKNYMMGSYHQAMEFFEILFNKKKYNALPKDLQAILRYAAEAATAANYWTAMDNYSADLQTLITKHKVNVIRTPKSIFNTEIKAWDVITKRLSDADPFFKKVVESQRAWAKRVAYYHFLNEADYRLAYEHVFKTKLPV
ncbi:MAG TPA: C4-dicarboxylate ABC transporter [Rhodocyclaceae bacterium]|nr:MAG: C4-dicarboxylate ABC transporter [Rhodocyclales bacterium CG17_big_fil_post_rev_8_21_14_2_50_68_7]PIX74648.1 MAG: C4-dicarboxylate ABC transporter [Rhodocyclales bacterium CG_4_10_14_3_um_filter_68_10]PJA57697.1 MAG: C4-dicarboxylate ABC transporter [Rhodocyclales bacterium CG_4_9_14_3_um_filter_68_10]HCX33846.1 C4-dicarboxylate ABC transporter [Rhodocyclaceae bacterium]